MNLAYVRLSAFSLIPGLMLTLFVLSESVASDQPLRETSPHDDFLVREEMVPMRDGVKLYTLMLTPKQAERPLPILLERTPYDATRALGGHPSEIRLNTCRTIRCRSLPAFSTCAIVTSISRSWWSQTTQQ